MNTVYTTGPTFHIVSVWEQPPCESCKSSAASPAAACASGTDTTGQKSADQTIHTPPSDMSASSARSTAHSTKAPTRPVEITPDMHPVIRETMYAEYIPLAVRQRICGTVFDLKNDRDHWRERAEKAEKDRDHWKANHDTQVACKRGISRRIDLQVEPLKARIRDLEAAQARQMATITELRQGIDTALASFCDPYAQLRDPAAEKFYQRWANHPEKPESSWRECPDCSGTGKTDAASLCGRCWTTGRIPTPPPEAKP